MQHLLLLFASGTPGAPDLHRYLLVSGAIIAGIAVLGWGFRRLFAGKLVGRASERSLRVLDVLPLGGRQKLAVVRCYDRTLALGLGDKEVGLLADLTEQFEEALEEASPEDIPTPEDPPGGCTVKEGDRPLGEFARLLDRIRPKLNPPSRAERENWWTSRLGRGEGLLG